MVMTDKHPDGHGEKTGGEEHDERGTYRDQRGWASFGDNSPMAGGDQHNYYGVSEGGRKTRVILEKESPSLISSTSTAVWSLLASIAAIGSSIWTISHFINGWPNWQAGSNLQTFLPKVAALFSSNGAILTGTVVLLVVAIAGWTYWNDRRRALPVFHRRHSLRRSLIPLRNRPGFFLRAKVYAECVACKDDNRPDVYGKLFCHPGDEAGIVRYKCKNGHLEAFRGRSIFAG